MKRLQNESYYRILAGLKDKIRLARLSAVISVNAQLLQAYWEIGNTIATQEKKHGWGSKVVEILAKDLQEEFQDMKGFSPRNLRYMRDFALAYPQFSILQTVSAKLKTGKQRKNKNYTNKTSKPILQTLSAKLPPQLNLLPLMVQLTWAHHVVLLTKLKGSAHRDFYIQKAAQNGWSSRVLALQIESGLHLRDGKAISNFQRTLPHPQSDLAGESFKNPYLFGFLDMAGKMQERELEKAFTANLKKFMLELGKGFAYVGNQFALNIAGEDYFLDLLFFNYHINCFVIFEIKMGAFKPEYAGKLNFYINVVDDKIKTAAHNPSIGILLCKTPDKTVVEYALRGLSNPLGVADYQLSRALPKQLKNDLPTVQELQQQMETGLSQLQLPQTAQKRSLKKKRKSVS
jgi:predicted nuclease of restriction endonuclease-like (RecB) superfamily